MDKLEKRMQNITSENFDDIFNIESVFNKKIIITKECKAIIEDYIYKALNDYKEIYDGIDELYEPLCTSVKAVREFIVKYYKELEAWLYEYLYSRINTWSIIYSCDISAEEGIVTKEIRILDIKDPNLESILCDHLAELKEEGECEMSEYLRRSMY